MNRIIKTTVLAAVALGLFAGPSLASRAAADACAAKLPANSQMIYAATVADVAPGVDLKDVVRSKTRSLVISGKLSRGDAEPAAEAAGACLKQVL
ncbi:MAG: hypothetical protein Q8M26_16055 [Pseudolabrys sp.]|nr:hypothetical protein [Pseudolabrys sp.]